MAGSVQGVAVLAEYTTERDEIGKVTALAVIAEYSLLPPVQIPARVDALAVTAEYTTQLGGRAAALAVTAEYQPTARGRANALAVLAEYSEESHSGTVNALALVVEYRGLTLGQISPASFSGAGGARVTLAGDFRAGTSYVVTSGGVRWAARRGGGGKTPVCAVDGALELVAPQLPPGAWDITVQAVGAAGTVTRAAAVTVTPRSDATSVAALRTATAPPRAL